MKMYEGFLPTNPNPNKTGYYPVCNNQEWDELPAVYKAMEWLPVETYDPRFGKRMSVVEYVEFDTPFLAPYKVRATVRVHRQEVQKILFCHHERTDCHLYSICAVVLANGERIPAEWKQDATTGAFAVYDYSGRKLGVQGGFLGFVPANIARTEDGGFEHIFNGGLVCHYEFSDPF